MKQIVLPLLATIIFITLVGLFTQKYQGKSLGKTVTLGEKTVSVEIVNTDSARQKGLSGRANLSENYGMLFIFESKEVFPSFWMKDMLIPIDILWITDNIITKIDKSVPIPKSNTPDKDLVLYHPDKATDYVLEVNAGFSDKNNIKVGDSVDLSKI